ncbi:MAG: hypothetical protein HOC23_05330 [Halieaceae bacterium]|jgi:hypothetical protein|nr:hypothetical protein [Halieaceae bacterium]
MNVQKTNHWIALIANFGVIAGVVFLAFEIQQNNELLVQESRYSMLENQKDWKFFLNGNPEVAKLIYAPDTGELSEVDKLRRFDILNGLLLTWQWEWEQSQTGLFGDSQLPVEAFRTLWKSQGSQTEWLKLKPTLRPEFADFMEDNVVNPAKPETQ